MRWKIEAKIKLKKEILDPQGSTTENALHSMGYEEVENVRVGKDITFIMEGKDRESVAEKVDEMCHRVLANPVIENYEYTIEKED